ncbi:MAG: alkaline phosphatase family protein [Sinobacteraceae bacterium]|nr:alkaline phosphatase family protein [Nevskiaceae bacterium]
MKAYPQRLGAGRAVCLSSLLLSVGCTATALAASDNSGATRTPIKHLVVIFGENISFDHYFGTYPYVPNTETPLFKAATQTPSVDGLTTGLLEHNPNLFNPVRLSRLDAYTCSFNHDYTAEQKANDGGLMDMFVQATSRIGQGCAADGSTVMGYYDGNTVTALWNYAQHYAMNDNSYGTNFGPSTPGALNLISGQTANGHLAKTFAGGAVATSTTVTVTGDPDPALDDCGADSGGLATGKGTVEMQGRNVGDLLNVKNVSWGWFQGGFSATSPAAVNGDGSTGTAAKCAASHIAHQYTPPGATAPVIVVPNPTINPMPNDIHVAASDYSAHHEPFQYYASTRNPHHVAPKTLAEIGHNGQANHQYDITDFYRALKANSLPAVSYLKAPRYQDAHPGNSDPTMEQTFLVTVINAIQQSSAWKDTAIFIQYDDSDGWYDHVAGPIVNHSANANGTAADDASTDANDSLIPTLPLSTSTAAAQPGAIPTSGVCGRPAQGGLTGRCGYGPRLPFLVISPWAKHNFVDHTLTDQSSSLKFIEYNWDLESIDEQEQIDGQGSFDRVAGPVVNMFDFHREPENRSLLLNLDGTVAKD